MSVRGRLVTAGRVGRPHGLDGSFKVEQAVHALPVGTLVQIGTRERPVRRRAGDAARPLVRLDGVEDRSAAEALRGELLLVRAEGSAPDHDEWLAEDLEGCLVPGLGRVQRVIGAPSCDVLELDDGTLIPLISDAVRVVDVAARRIEVDRVFLGLEERST
ncbi:MAG: ribosome maturation factor RimM [Thermoleophilaceae bacterium]